VAYSAKDKFWETNYLTCKYHGRSLTLSIFKSVSVESSFEYTSQNATDRFRYRKARQSFITRDLASVYILQLTSTDRDFAKTIAWSLISRLRLTIKDRTQSIPRQRVITGDLTCTVLSRTTCDTVSRSCAAMPGLPRPRVNFLSLILVVTDQCRLMPARLSGAAASTASRCIGHRIRPHRQTIGVITHPRVSATIDYDRNQLPSAIANRVPSRCADNTANRRSPAGERSRVYAGIYATDLVVSFPHRYVQRVNMWRRVSPRIVTHWGQPMSKWGHICDEITFSR